VEEIKEEEIFCSYVNQISECHAFACRCLWRPPSRGKANEIMSEPTILVENLLKVHYEYGANGKFNS
jgi:hypothetical protein